jgi:hypothetical protein
MAWAVLLEPQPAMTGMRPAAYSTGLFNDGDMFLLAQGDRLSRGPTATMALVPAST